MRWYGIYVQVVSFLSSASIHRDLGHSDREEHVRDSFPISGRSNWSVLLLPLDVCIEQCGPSFYVAC